MNPKILTCLILDVISKKASKEDAEEELVELKNLTETAGGLVIKKIIQKRGSPSNKTYLGSGKILEALALSKELEVDVIICNTILKTNQVLNLKKMFKKEIWDRVDLILNIFDKHAKTDEAYLQIKLARLNHEFPKLYARQATTLFERQRGGSGTRVRGSGEKGIEDEKRHIRWQIKELEKKIGTFKEVRNNQRKKRKRQGLITVAIVGYTNAGKSSLLQALTNKEVYIADELFATLDTRIGKTWIPDLNKEILIADTIGFIRDLPPFLISSFKATLEEAIEADLLLHVIDSTDPKIRQKIKVVENILQELNLADTKTLFVFNKKDLLIKKPKIPRQKRFQDPILVSSVTKEGLNELKEKIAQVLLVNF